MRLALLAAALVLPLSCLAASPPPPDLVFTVCKTGDPDDCQEARVPIGSLEECRNGWDVQFLMVRWLEDHPTWERRGSYRCQLPERGA